MYITLKYNIITDASMIFFQTSQYFCQNFDVPIKSLSVYSINSSYNLKYITLNKFNKERENMFISVDWRWTLASFPFTVKYNTFTFD